MQVLRQLGLMADMDIDELENLAQSVEVAKHQVCNPMSSLPSGLSVTNFTRLILTNI